MGIHLRIIFLIASVIGLPGFIVYAGINPTSLTCEYLPNPAVVDVKQPRLAWINIAEKGERGQKQTAWQVRVDSSPERPERPDLWDSRKVRSENSNRIKYEGKESKSRQE